MGKLSLYQIGIPAAIVLGGLLLWFFLTAPKRERLQQRIARATRRKVPLAVKSADALSLRKGKELALPFIGKALQDFAPLAILRGRLERAGLAIGPDIAVTGCCLLTLVIAVTMIVLHKPTVLSCIVAFAIGIVIPHFVLGFLGAQRIKKFLTLFPDAIDFIVRGLRSGLPVTESMNLVGAEMAEPIGGIFSSIGESVKLGVSVEKALTDTAKKLKSTEFNFFVTSLVLQRETGGNLSEILNNLSEVLRRRFMMRMKIKAMASEAKASAIIVGSLPFFVVGALWVVSPGYLDPLFNDERGHKAAYGAIISLIIGISIMIKMTKFEI